MPEVSCITSVSKNLRARGLSANKGSVLSRPYTYIEIFAQKEQLCLSSYDRFFATSRVPLLSKPSGTFCVLFSRLMFRFVSVIIVVASWL